MNQRIAFCLAISFCLFVGFARADWQEPADGALTDKQISAYISVTRELLQQLKSAGKAADASNGPAALAIVQRADANAKAAIAKSGMTQPEFEWVAQRVWEARGYLLAQNVVAKFETELADRLKKSEDELIALKKSLVAAESAAKAGRKILTSEQRAEVIAAAKSEQQSVLEEVKQHTEMWGQAAEEAAKAESDVKTEAAALKRMPKKMNEEERQAYLDQHTKARNEALAAAKDARTREAEAKKQCEALQDKADLAGWRADNPDVPVTPEEKAETVKQNEEAIVSLKSQIQAAAEADKAMRDNATELRKQFAEAKSQPGARNATIMKAHMKELEAVFPVENGK